MNTIQVDVQDNTIGVASTSTASNTTANGAGFFVHGGGDGNKEILFNTVNSAFQVNQNWHPDSDNARDLGKAGQEWKDLFLDGTATIDTLTINDGASIDEGADFTFNGASSKDMVWDSSDGNLEFADNAAATFGNSDDLSIFHNGSHSIIQESGTGQLKIQTNTLSLENAAGNANMISALEGNAVVLHFNGASKLSTKTDGVDITGELQCDTLDVDGNVDFDGGQVTFNASANTLDFDDQAKAQFGAGDDLQIYHTGAHSYIRNTQGTLHLDNYNGDIKIRAQNAEDGIKVISNGPVELYHNDAEKLSTEAYGVDITGTLQSDTLIVTGVSTVASLIFSAGTNLSLIHI